jgi:hypothetical protein
MKRASISRLPEIGHEDHHHIPSFTPSLSFFTSNQSRFRVIRCAQYVRSTVHSFFIVCVVAHCLTQNHALYNLNRHSFDLYRYPRQSRHLARTLIINTSNAMALRTLLAALTAFAAIRQAAAQTFTDCNPLNKTCPANPALGGVANFDMTQKANPSVWNTTAGPMTYGSNGAEFTIREQGQSPTIQSEFYIMFGSVSVVMQAAKGKGIISSIVLESDDLDGKAFHA